MKALYDLSIFYSFTTPHRGKPTFQYIKRYPSPEGKRARSKWQRQRLKPQFLRWDGWAWLLFVPLPLTLVRLWYVSERQRARMHSQFPGSVCSDSLGTYNINHTTGYKNVAYTRCNKPNLRNRESMYMAPDKYSNSYEDGGVQREELRYLVKREYLC